MANRFWVLGIGTWDGATTTNWSATSGGAGGASVPTSTDDVIFDALSGTGTVTVSGTVVCQSFTGTGSTLAVSFNNSSSNVINVGSASGGNFIVGAGMSFTGTAGVATPLTLISTSSNGGIGWTLNTNGVTIAPLKINGIGGKWVLGGNVTITTGGSGQLQLIAGTLDTSASNYSISSWSFVSNGSNTRQLTLNNSVMSLSSTTGTVWNTSSTGLTFSYGTGNVNFTGGGTVSILTGGVTMPHVVFSGVGGTDTFNDAFTCGGTITLSTGTLATGGNNVSCTTFLITNGGASTFSPGNSIITVTSGTTSTFNGTALTVSPNTAIFYMTAASPGWSCNGTAINWNGMTVMYAGVATGSNNFSPNNCTIANLVVVNTAVAIAAINITSNATVTGTVVFQGNSGLNRLIVQSSAIGSQRIINVNGSMTASLALAGISGSPFQTQYVDFMDISLVQTYQQQVLSDAPVLYWPFNDAVNSTTTTDLSGNAITGTVTPTVTFGQTGLPGDLGDNAALFDGISGKVTGGNPAQMAFGTSSFSYELWFKTSWAGATGFMIPIYKGGASAANAGFDIELAATDKKLRAHVSDGTNTASSVASVAVNDGNWHHYVVVIDRTAQTLTAYLDGVSTGTGVSIATIGSVTNTNTFTVSQTADYWNGTLAHVSIYNSALNTNQIQSHYNCGLSTIFNLANITGGVGDCLGNSNITFTPSVTRYWVAASGSGTSSWSATSSWSTTTGGATGASVPLPQDTAIFDANSFGSTGLTVQFNMARLCSTLDTSAVLTLYSITQPISNTFFGNLNLKMSMVTGTIGSNLFSVAGRGNQTIRWGGASAGTGTFSLSNNGVGSTYTLLDALNLCSTSYDGTSSGSFNFNQGVINTNNFTVTCVTMTSVAAGSAILGTSTINLMGSTALTIVSLNQSSTISANSAILAVAVASTSTRTMTLGGLHVFGTIQYTVPNSPGVLQISGSGASITINNLVVTP